ncbi:MAG: DNA-3-methyladenine glycosylase 2 family protein [Burkholderiales bacterium]|nr:DNA-3-methyladenine glycosylase 2 family protein [Burkholderiales bacterium]MBK6569250.1 DNA-3-methyladenine glycosylase 2 family protein [Burkholderiales bacterium]MBK7280676.1 DNA-3-methyladenine glycosylase 2 family protein [Burkholderiales bacterium]
MATPAASDACYLALKARDARFDGRFFTGITSTGIYCRPVCKVRTPKRENCLFFALAAQAESAGFRPCLRCRPELAPAGAAGSDTLRPWSTQDASFILARQAAELLDEPGLWSDGTPSMANVAARLGVSERHVRRIFETHWGVSPLQYLQTRRLLMAKRLLTDTRLPVAQVAGLSGFSSVRRFNASFVEHYRLQPRQLRQKRDAQDTQDSQREPSAIVLKASYRPPYDVAAMLDFFATRLIDGVESVEPQQLTLARTLALPHGGRTLVGWVRVQFVPDACSVVFQISPSLGDVLPQVLARLRALLDLDADPWAVNAALQGDFPGFEGQRVPGCLDGFELGVRAILGQQITVKAACTLGTRLVERFGTDLPAPVGGMRRLFPTPQALAQATGDALGQIGIVRQRQRAIQALAQAVADGHLMLQPGVDIADTLAALQALPGIGPWTAQYIAMRALRWPDAFVAGDVALQKALGVRDAKNPALAAEQASERWKPWRSYAVVRAWASLAPTSTDQ